MGDITEASEERNVRKSKRFLAEEKKRLKEEEKRKKRLEKSDRKLEKEMEKLDKKLAKEREKEAKKRGELPPKKREKEKKGKEKTEKDRIKKEEKTHEKLLKEENKKKEIEKKKIEQEKKRRDNEKKKREKDIRKREKENLRKEEKEKRKLEREKIKKEKEKEKVKDKDKVKEGEKNKEKKREIEKNKEKKREIEKNKEKKREIEKNKEKKREIKKNKENNLAQAIINYNDEEDQFIKEHEAAYSVILRDFSKLICTTLFKKEEVQYKDSIKAKFTIENPSGSSFQKKFLIKIYVHSLAHKPILLKMVNNTAKFPMKLSVSFRPAQFHIYDDIFFSIEFIKNKKIFFSIETDSIKILPPQFNKMVNIKKIFLNTPDLIPNNPCIIWFQLLWRNPLFSSIDFSLPIEITLSDEKTNNLIIDYQTTLKLKAKSNALDMFTSEELIPIKVPVNNFEGSARKANIEIIWKSENIKSENHNEKKNKIKIPVMLQPEWAGFKIDHIGYKHQVKVGESAYLVGEIKNQLPGKIKGKAFFSFFTPIVGTWTFLKRKFHIDPRNYENLSEDITLPILFSRQNYWTILQCHVKAKIQAKKKSLIIEGISDLQRPAESSTDMVIGSLKTNFAPTDINLNQEVIVGVDVRFTGNSFVKGLEAVVVEHYENTKHREIFHFNCKDPLLNHQTFHWKVPKQPGKYQINLYLRYKDRFLPDTIIDVKPINMEMY